MHWRPVTPRRHTILTRVEELLEPKTGSWDVQLVKASFVCVGLARSRAHSRWITATHFQSRCELEWLFVLAWPGKKTGPAWPFPHTPRPGSDPRVLPSGSKPGVPARRRLGARRQRSWRRKEATARRRELTVRRRGTAPMVTISHPTSTLSAAFSPVRRHPPLRSSCFLFLT